MSTTRTASVRSLAELDVVEFPPAPFCVLVALDARELTVDQIAAGLEHVLRAGAAYLCVWGPDCERVHDIADELVVGDGDGSPWSHVVTTWDDADSLSNAASFAREEAIPEGMEPDDDFTLLGLAVGDPDWARRMAEVFDESE